MRRSPGRAIGESPVKGSPDACASRCRTVEPGGPARSSRSTVPSSAATSTVNVVTSLVTEAQRKTWPASPSVATIPLGRHAAGGGVVAVPPLDLPQSVHAAILRAMEPWSHEFRGRLDEHVFSSDVLKNNPLGDPADRPLWVYVPAGYDDAERRYPSV